MFATRVVAAEPLAMDQSGYFTVHLGTVAPEQVEVVNKVLSHNRVAYALRTESKMGKWCDNDISAANFRAGYNEPAVSVRSLVVTDQGLSAVIKPVGRSNEQLRTRLQSGVPVTVLSFIDEKDFELFITKW